MSVSQITMTADAYRVCLSHALTTEKEEIVGLLLGNHVRVCVCVCVVVLGDCRGTSVLDDVCVCVVLCVCVLCLCRRLNLMDVRELTFTV